MHVFTRPIFLANDNKEISSVKLNKLSTPVLQKDDQIMIARVVVSFCWLPNPEIVRELKEAVFPVVRCIRRRGEDEFVEKYRKSVLYDDNTTPRWAFLWSHGYLKTSLPSSGWTLAHVWAKSKDPEAYTHLANLVMMPECLASLSDKEGPLVKILRYHAQSKYDWRPNQEPVVEKPICFDDLEWNYLDPICNPREQVNRRLCKSKDRRAETLRRLLGLQIDV